MKQSVDARAQFISILNNKDKEPGKKRGVLLLIGPAQDLSILEQACFDSEQTSGILVSRHATRLKRPCRNSSSVRFYTSW